MKLYCNVSDLFCQFLWALRLSGRKSEILKDSTGTCGQILRSCIPEIIFSKKVKFRIVI